MDLTVFVFSLYFFLFFHVKYILHCKLLWLHVVYDAAAPVLCHCLVWKHSATVGLDACCDAHKQYVGIKRVLENIRSKLTHGIDCTPSRRDSRLPLLSLVVLLALSSPDEFCDPSGCWHRALINCCNCFTVFSHRVAGSVRAVFLQKRKIKRGC